MKRAIIIDLDDASVEALEVLCEKWLTTSLTEAIELELEQAAEQIREYARSLDA